jgi:hypothetical protein
MEHSKLIILICILTTCFLKTSNAQSDCWSNGFYNRPAKETSGGRYREPNYVASHPYTVFDKRKTGWTLSSNITEIRQMLMYEEEIPEIDREFLNLYSALYNFAMQPFGIQTVGGGVNSTDNGNSTLASWAKANAFCYLIKLNASAQDISSNTDALNLLWANCLTAFDHTN